MNLAVILEMGVLAIVALVIGWWAGRSSLSTALTISQRTERDHSSRNAQLESEIRGLRDERNSSQIEKTRSEEQLQAARQSLQEERASFDALKREMENTFKSLAGDALRANNDQFLGIAKRELSAKEDAVRNLLSPVQEALGDLKKETQELEVKREGAYTAVLAEITNIQTTHQALRTETTQLVQALRAPKARGNWGEMQLQRCIEFAGMVEHCSFDVQTYMRGNEDESVQRPDVIVRLPNGRAIVVDAKTPLDAFLSAMSETDEAQRTAFLKRHATQVRTHLDQLGGKRYWERFRNSPDFVVCFLPSEVLFSAALEQDPSLIEIGSQLNVILATPTTLIALLKAVAYGWQQMEITRNAIEICETGEKLYKKLAGVQSHFARMGTSLKNTVSNYNSLVGAVEGQGSVFRLADTLHELKIGQEEIAEIAPVEINVRELESSHWDSSVALAAAEEGAEE